MNQLGTTVRSRDESPSHAVRIMVVDDDPFARDVIVTTLGQIDGAVVAAYGAGAAAVAAAALFHPDVVVLDLVMPEMDGRATWQNLRPRLTAPAGLMMLTADTDPATEADLIRLGAVAVIAKPFRPEVLRDAVARLAGRTAERTRPSLEAVAGGFIQSLRPTAIKLKDAWDALAARWDDGAAAVILAESHRLAGSAGLFKCHQLGETADRLELLLRGAITAGGWRAGIERETLESDVQALISACEAAAA